MFRLLTARQALEIALSAERRAQAFFEKVLLGAEDPALEPGRTPDVTTLWDEGCGGISQRQLLESFARHFNAWVHTFETDGMHPVHEAWMGRAELPTTIISPRGRNCRRRWAFFRDGRSGLST